MGSLVLTILRAEVWVIKKGKTPCVKPRYTFIPGGLYTHPPANLTLAAASSLDGNKKRESKRVCVCMWNREKERERMAKDEVMAKVKETEWRGSVSPYRRSKIDPGVLELSKLDSWGTMLQVCSPTWTNKDIQDIYTCWTTGHCLSSPPSVHLHPSAERHRGHSDFIFGLSICDITVWQAFYMLSNWCSSYPECAQRCFLFLSRDKVTMLMSNLGFSHGSYDDRSCLAGSNT